LPGSSRREHLVTTRAGLETFGECAGSTIATCTTHILAHFTV